MQRAPNGSSSPHFTVLIASFLSAAISRNYDEMKEDSSASDLKVIDNKDCNALDFTFDSASNFEQLKRALAENETATALQINQFEMTPDKVKALSEEKIQWNKNSKISKLIFEISNPNLFICLLLFANNKKIDAVQINIKSYSIFENRKLFIHVISESLNKCQSIVNLEFNMIKYQFFPGYSVAKIIRNLRHVRSIYLDNRIPFNNKLCRALLENNTLSELKYDLKGSSRAYQKNQVKKTKALLALNAHYSYSSAVTADWQNIAFLIAFVRANKDNMFSSSILGLIKKSDSFRRYLPKQESIDHKKEAIKLMRELFPDELKEEFDKSNFHFDNNEIDVESHSQIILSLFARFKYLHEVSDSAFEVKNYKAFSSERAHLGNAKELLANLLTVITPDPKPEMKEHDEKDLLSRNSAVDKLKTQIRESAIYNYKWRIDYFMTSQEFKYIPDQDLKNNLTNEFKKSESLFSWVTLDQRFKKAYAEHKQQMLRHIKECLQIKKEFPDDLKQADEKLDEKTSLKILYAKKSDLTKECCDKINFFIERRFEDGCFDQPQRARFHRDRIETVDKKNEPTVFLLANLTKQIKEKYHEHLARFIEPYKKQLIPDEKESLTTLSLEALENIHDKLVLAYRKSIQSYDDKLNPEIKDSDHMKSLQNLKDLKDKLENAYQAEYKALEGNLPQITWEEISFTKKDFQSPLYKLNLFGFRPTSHPLAGQDAPELPWKQKLNLHELLKLAKFLFLDSDIKLNVNAAVLKKKFVQLNNVLEKVPEDAKQKALEILLTEKGFKLLHTAANDAEILKFISDGKNVLKL